jgi:hypothetical protein
MTEIPSESMPQWPIGPEYTEWVNATEARAWVLYKLKSADWYINTLDTIGTPVGFARLVGVEMAFDGALTALSGAFDAAVGGIFEAVNVHSKSISDPPSTVEPHNYNWENLKGPIRKLNEASLLGFDVTKLFSEVDSALSKNPPLGWLESFRRVRNVTVHRNTLPRHNELTADGEINWQIEVGRQTKGGDVVERGTPVSPVKYLRDHRALIGNLVESVLAVINHLSPEGVPASGGAQSVTVHARSAWVTFTAHAPTITAR